MIVNGYKIGPYVDLRDANLCSVDLSDANLCRANLCGANLHRADLHGADLRGTNLDFATWPLWCGTKDVILDEEQQDQLCLHLYWAMPNDPDMTMEKLTLKAVLKPAAKRAADKRNVEL